MYSMLLLAINFGAPPSKDVSREGYSATPEKQAAPGLQNSVLLQGDVPPDR